MNKPLCLLLAGVALAAAPTTALAAEDPSIPFEKVTLDNGLELLLSQDRRLPLVAVNLWYHVGAVDEVPGRSGFAHLFEHIMFQGSRNVAEDTFFRHLEGAGATLVNGTTDFDRTNYFETVPSNQLELALWLESDRMGWLLDTLGAERLANQKAVVRKERQQAVENVPYGPAEEKLIQLAYPAPHPYFGNVIGTHEDLEAATLEDVSAFFRTYYGPNNATLAIVGDFEPEKARELVAKYFGDIPRGPEVKRPDVTTLPITAERRAVVEDEVELPKVYLAWVTSPAYRPGDAELQVGAQVLGGGKASRLYRRLVYDRKIAQAVKVFQYPLIKGSIFWVEVLGKPGQTPETLEAEAARVIEELQVQGPTQAEVDRALRGVQAELLRGLEKLGGFGGKADLLNAYNHYVKDPGYLEEDLARYRAVTPALVKEVMAAQLRKEARVVVHCVPVKAAPEAPASPAAAAPAPAAPEVTK